jgi:DeoR/GlpR family transcriptional regulator of sugar metabolism
MLTSQRKAHILAILKRDGQVVAKTLSQDLGLSEDTIRRDLRELASEGLLQRVHGGALPASPAVVDFAGRQQIASEPKAAIGRAAAAMVRPGQLVFLDGGTTAVQMARHLPRDLRATIVTHSPSIAVTLVEHPELEVILIGGRLFKHSLVTVGAATMEAISRVHADAYFMGVTGIHPSKGLSTGDFEEAQVKRALMAAAADTIVLASSEKLNAVSPHVIAPLDDVSGIVTTRDAPQDFLDACAGLGISITLV